MLVHNKKNFETYPTNRIVAIVDSKMEADEVCCELMDAGFDHSQIDESVGKEGLKFLDPDGRSHGLMTRLIRQWQVAAQGEEYKYLKLIKQGLKEGHTIVSVPALSKTARKKAAEILRSHHAEAIRFYGRFHVERLDAA
jgi:GNAT superfamily N-acetyltransferase